MKEPADLAACQRELQRERAARKEAERVAEEATLAHAVLVDGLEAAKEEVLEAKREVLRMSALVLPIWPKVLLMPVIGRVDDDRAALLLRTILEEAQRARANVAILDVSGVPRFERGTGRLLKGFHDALALVGTRMVLCGVRPEVAHGATSDGDDSMTTLARIPTRTTLINALRWAIENSSTHHR